MHETKISDRRRFLQDAGLVAVTLSVPAWVWGCGKSESASGATKNAAWEAKATELEGGGVLTAAAPGKWEGKAGGHVPQVTFKEGAVELFTKHPMSPDHWITAHYVKNQDGVVIGLQEYLGTDSEARHTFTLAAGTTQITAYSHCNLHDHWSADPTQVG